MYGFDEGDYVRRQPDNLIGKIFRFDGNEVLIEWFMWNDKENKHTKTLAKHSYKILFHCKEADESYLMVDKL